MNSVIDKQVKSKKRVTDHGEVFTNEREVNSMLNLVKQETERLESRFLEPACGDGNFLAEILKIKMSAVIKKSKNDFEWKKNSAIAISSVYGVELLEDNVLECRKRLFDIFYNNFYKKRFKQSTDESYLSIIKMFLSLNIICGDALSLKDAKHKPLVFAEWGWIGNKVQRRDFALSGLINDSKQSLIDYSKDNSKNNNQMSIFDDLPDENFENAGLIKENVYKLVNYWELGEKK